MEIVKQNVRIPLILIDECHDVLQTRNLNIPIEIERDSRKKKSFIINELETMERLGDSIFIDVFGEKQRLYYKNSDMLNQTSMMHEFTLEKQKFTKEILNENEMVSILSTIIYITVRSFIIFYF